MDGLQCWTSKMAAFLCILFKDNSQLCLLLNSKTQRYRLLPSIVGLCSLRASKIHQRSAQCYIWVAPKVSILRTKVGGGYWLTTGWMGQIASTLFASPKCHFKDRELFKSRHSAAFSFKWLSVSHKCLEVLEMVYSSRLDLSGQPLTQADWDLCADSGSLLDHEQCWAGYARMSG